MNDEEVQTQQVGDEHETPVGETIANAQEPEDAISSGSLGGGAGEGAGKDAGETPAETPSEVVPATDEAEIPSQAQDQAGVEVDEAGETVEAESAETEQPTRTTDDIRDDEWSETVLTKNDGAQHRVKWVNWGTNQILVRAVSYAGPDFLCDSLEHATQLVPLLP